MRVLSRHFLASYLNLFATILIASLAVISIIEVLLDSDDLLRGGASGSGIASYLFLRLPSYYLRDLVPVSSFAAALLCIGLAARSREVLAAKAGGISPQRMVGPILAAATLFSLTALALDESVVLAATREWNRRENRGAAAAYRQGAFWYRRNDAIFNVQAADIATGTLHGVRIYETNPRGRLLRSSQADVVEIDADSRWHLRDAVIRTFDPNHPTAAPNVERRDEVVAAVPVGPDLALLDAGAQALSLRELAAYIHARADSGRETPRLREMFHARLANPWSVLAFALLAIPLGLSVERRRGLAAAAVLGVAFLGVFYAARGVGAILAGAGWNAAAHGPWWILGAVLCFGAFHFARAPR